MRTLHFLFLSLLCAGYSYAQPSIQWQKAYGGMSNEVVYDVIQTSDGGYLVAGSSLSSNGDLTGNKGLADAWLLKLTASGAISWQKNYGGTLDENAGGVIETSDGGFVFVGSTESSDGDVTGHKGNSDIWLVKTDNTGNISWKKTIGGTNNDYGEKITATADGGFIILGHTASSDGDAAGNGLHGTTHSDVWVVKTTNTGSINWQKAYGGDSAETGISISRTSSNDYIIGGVSKSKNGDVAANKGAWDYWMLKIYSTGSIAWEKSYGSAGHDLLKSCTPTSDGGYIVTGVGGTKDGDITTSHGSVDAFTFKTDNNGSIEWAKPIGGSKSDVGNDIWQNAEGQFIFAGTTFSKDSGMTGWHGESDMLLAALYPDGSYRWRLVLGGSKWDVATKIIPTSDGGYLAAGMTMSTDGNTSGSGFHGSGSANDIWLIKLSSTVDVGSVKGLIPKLFPNPMADRLSISNLPPGTMVRLYGVAGNMIKEMTVESAATTLQTSELPAGTYTLQFEDRKGNIGSMRVVKQ